MQKEMGAGGNAPPEIFLCETPNENHLLPLFPVSSANQTNNKIDPVKNDVLPENARENTTRDTKLQSPSEQINKHKTQEQLPVKSTDVENKEVKVEAPASKPNVEQNMVPVKVSADVDRKDQIQPVVSANQNNEAGNTTRDTKLQSPSEQINKHKTQEQLPVKSTDVENKEVQIETPASKPNVEQNMVPVKVSADVDRKDQIQPVVSANQNTEAENTTTDKILQSPSQQINKRKTQDQLLVKSTDEENKEVKVEAPASKPNVEQNMVPVKVSADVDRKDQIQPVVSATKNTEAENTTRDTKLQSPSERINKHKTQEQLPVKSTDVENKEVKVEAPASKPNVEQNMVPVKVSADVDRKDQIQPAVSATKNTEAENTTRDTKLQSPSEQINKHKTQEQLLVKSTDEENKEVKVEAPASKPNVEQNMVPVKVSADVDRKDQIQPVVSANQNTEAENTTRDTKLQSPSQQINKQKTQEQLPVKSTDEENKEVKVEAPASKPNVEQNMVPVKVSADVDRKDQIQPAVSANQNTEAAEPPPANKAAEVKETKTDTNPTNVDYQVSSDLQVKVSVTDTAEVPATPVVVLKPQEEALFRTQPANTSSLEDAGVKVSVQTTNGSSEKASLKKTQEEIVPNPLQFMVEELPENTSSPDEDVSFQTSVDSHIHLESVSKSPTQPGNETPAEDSYEKHPLEQDDKKTVKAEAEVETPNVDNATPSEEAPRVNSLQPVTYTLPEPHAAEDVVIAVKYEVDPEEDTEEPVLKKNTEEIVVAEVQSANNAAVEQNVKPSLEDVVDPVDLNIEDALKPILAADSEDVLNGSDYRAIELTDAPDVKTAQKESVPKTEESQKFNQQKPDQQPIDTKVSEELQKPAEELKSSQVPKIYRGGRPACSYCNKIIDGNIKLILSEPSVVCHPECLKKNPKAVKYIEARGLNVTKCGKDQECGVCARILGDLLTRIYLHENVIKCDVCFARALNI